MPSDNVLTAFVQNALSRAYPSGLPSNQVLQQFALPSDTGEFSDAVSAVVYPVGYPYGWGELVNNWASATLTNTQVTAGALTLTSGSTSGNAVLSLTETEASAWIIRADAYIPPSCGVSLSLTVGGGAQQTYTAVSPALASVYADNLFPWSLSSSLGVVGVSPWGTPKGWPDSTAIWIGPDATAITGDSPGQWLVRKWVFAPSAQTYTVSLAADAQATLFVDGVQVVQATSYSTTAQASVSLSHGFHWVTVDVINYGTSVNPTGVLVSIADSSGNIIENGLDESWETSGYINPVWSLQSGAPLMTYSWFVVSAPSSKSVTAQVNLTGTASVSPTVNNLWWHGVSVWRWDKGGVYDGTVNTALPVNVSTVGSV